MTDVNTNTNVAYDFIRNKIVRGEYAPGKTLVTGVLAPDIGVSRTPVRDALRKLEVDGLVVFEPHVGARVKKLDAEEYCEMCDLRLTLESHCAFRAALRRTDLDLLEITSSLEAMKRLTSAIVAGEGNSELHMNEMARRDVQFHLAIMTASKNSVMKKEVLRLHLISRVLLGPISLDEGDSPEFKSRRQSILASHMEIHDAISRADAPRAKATMEAHLQESIDNILAILARSSSSSITDELVPSRVASAPRPISEFSLH